MLAAAPFAPKEKRNERKRKKNVGTKVPIIGYEWPDGGVTCSRARFRLCFPLVGRLRGFFDRMVLCARPLAAAAAVACTVCHLRKEDARVEDGEERDGDEDEGAVEDEEAGLVLHDVVAPAAGHFCDSGCVLALAATRGQRVMRVLLASDLCKETLDEEQWEE